MASPDQATFPSLDGPPVTASEQLAHLNPDNPRQMGQVVVLVARTGNGKIAVRETVGRGGVFAVHPWRLRDREDRRQRIATATLRRLPWAGRGPDPGLPPGPDEKDESQQEIAL